jgi:hypothetical protein
MRVFVVLLMIPVFTACTVASMGTSGMSQKALGLGGGGGPGKAVESFTAAASLKKVDILFIDDNSASMDPLQSSLGSKFAAFASAVSGLDWQIGITTTDCSAGPYGICGSLLPMTGWNDYILTPSVPNFATVFDNTIVRPETVGCVQRGSCPSGISEPLKATMTSFDKRATTNARFFRPGASLAVIILTDADEMDSGPSNATQPQAVIDHFNLIWGNSKELKVYAIDIIPGDQACLQKDQSTSAGLSYYGVGPSGLASDTGGLSESICSNNYTPLLQQIGGDLQNMPTVVTLAHNPVSQSSVSVSFTPSPGTTETMTLTGNVMTFSPPLPQGTVIQITYDY